LGAVAHYATVPANHLAMRQLPTPCRWSIKATEAHLYWHYGCVGYVARDGVGWRLYIQWGLRHQSHRVVSLDQGVRYLTSYICAREGLPRIKRRD
jgi:hypothetical protein